LKLTYFFNDSSSPIVEAQDDDSNVASLLV